MNDPDPAAPGVIPAEEAHHTALRSLAKSLGTTVDAFADRFGVSRRTLYKWEARGCPCTSEQAIRAWAHHSKIHLRAAADSFSDLVAPAAPPSPPVGTKNAEPTPAGQEATKPSPAAQVALKTADLRGLQAEKAQLEIDQLRSVLVHRDHVTRCFGQLGLSMVAQFTDLPHAAVRALGDDVPADHRPAVRQAVQGAVDALRAHFAKTLRSELHRALLPGAP